MSGEAAAATVKLTIDGRAVEVPPGTLIVEAARRAGIHIPVFCYHPRLKPAGVCRMCLVRVENLPKLVPACTTAVTPGMAVDTRGPEVTEAQRSVLEFLLINHPLDCPVCDKGGECELQDLTFRYGPAVSRLADGKVKRRKALELGPFIVLDEERCILCRRCVRFDDEVAGEAQLVVEERAARSTIATAGGRPYAHPFTGNVVELCPVGALTSVAYRFRARPWDISPVESRCSLCSVHCPVRLDFRHGELMRVVSTGAPVEPVFGSRGPMQAYHTPVPDVEGARGMGWLCDRGRFNYRYLHAAGRPIEPLFGQDPARETVPWETALDRVAQAIRQAIDERGPESVAFIGGGRLMAEEAVWLRTLADALGVKSRDHRVGGQALTALATPSGREGRIEDVVDADRLILIGQPVAERAPVFDLAVRAAAARGVRLTVLGLERPAYRGQVEFVAAGQGRAAAWLAANQPELVVAVRSGAVRRPVIVWDGEGAWDGTAATVATQIVRLAGALESAGAERVSILIPGLQAQSRAAEAAGLVPAGGGCSTLEALRRAAGGEMQVLYLVSANLLDTFPDAGLVEEALARTPVVIAQDLFVTDTAKRARWVLPVAASVTREGTLVDFDGVVRFSGRALPPEEGAWTDAGVLRGLHRRLVGREPEAVHVDESFAAAPGWDVVLARIRQPGPRGPAGRSGLVVTGDGEAEKDGTPGAAPRVFVMERLFGGGGTLAHDPAAGGHRVSLAFHVHPDDAAALGLREGMPVRLATRHGELTAPVSVSPRVAPGWVGVPRGAAQGEAGRLTAWYDPHPKVQLSTVAAEVVG